MKNSNIPLFFTLALLFVFFIPTEGFAQDIPQLQDFNQTRIDYNQKGMLILGSWAVEKIWFGVG